MEEIDRAFSLGTDLSTLRRNAQSPEWIKGENALVTRIKTEMPATGIGYSILRDGIELDGVSTTLRLGDTISFKPKVEIPSDWTQVGGVIGTPPIQFLADQERDSLYLKLLQKFKQNYPTGHHFNHVYNYIALGAQEKFSTNRTTFKTTEDNYLASNGFPAYITPIADGRKAGIQIFCSNNLRSETLECIGKGETLECTVKKSGLAEISLEKNCFVHVDKIIYGNEAIDAGWVSQLGSLSDNTTYYPLMVWGSYKLELQVIPKGKIPPVAELECTVLSKPQPQNPLGEIECNASQSYDPDGKIERFEWDKDKTAPPLQVKYRRKTASEAAVTLRVYDNDGLYGEKTKIVYWEGEPKKLELSAEYNAPTKKAMISLKNCPQGTTQAFIDIDLLQETDAKKTLSVLEKQQFHASKPLQLDP
ncbi:MAG: hypothetical protein QXK06_00020 [Candidatus Diapherotrites archaeon]